MNECLAIEIENYLLGRVDWVSSGELLALFDITERQLRAVGNRPGLCSEFAISSDKGYRHIRHATTAEYLRFKHRLRRHGIGELRRIHQLDQRRHNVTRTTRSFEYENDTGQGILL